MYFWPSYTQRHEFALRDTCVSMPSCLSWPGWNNGGNENNLNVNVEGTSEIHSGASENRILLI